MKLRIESDGTPEGTLVLDENGNAIEGVTGFVPLEDGGVAIHLKGVEVLHQGAEVEGHDHAPTLTALSTTLALQPAPEEAADEAIAPEPDDEAKQ